MSEFPVAHDRDGNGMAMRTGDRWHLWRNVAEPGQDDDWAYWHRSVPHTGQEPATALNELLTLDRDSTP